MFETLYHGEINLASEIDLSQLATMNHFQFLTVKNSRAPSFNQQHNVDSSNSLINEPNKSIHQFQRPRGLRRGSAVAGLLGLWVRIPPGAWMSVCCECCVL